MELIPQIFLTALLIAIAIWDIKFLRIPNWIILLIIGLYAMDQIYLHYGIAPPFSQTWMPASIAFIICLILYSTKIIGAGDAKLIPVLMLWLTTTQIYPFILFTALIGGGLAIITLVLSKTDINKEITWSKWIQKAMTGQNKLPYGVAISGGFLLSVNLF